MSNLKKCVRVEKQTDKFDVRYGCYQLLIEQEVVTSSYSLVPVISLALSLYYADRSDLYFEDNLFELMQKTSCIIIDHEGAF